MEMNRMPLMSGRNERMMMNQDMPPRMMPPRDMNNQPPRGKVKLVLMCLYHHALVVCWNDNMFLCNW